MQINRAITLHVTNYADIISETTSWVTYFKKSKADAYLYVIETSSHFILFFSLDNFSLKYRPEVNHCFNFCNSENKDRIYCLSEEIAKDGCVWWKKCSKVLSGYSDTPFTKKHPEQSLPSVQSPIKCTLSRNQYGNWLVENSPVWNQEQRSFM